MTVIAHPPPHALFIPDYDQCRLITNAGARNTRADDIELTERIRMDLGENDTDNETSNIVPFFCFMIIKLRTSFIDAVFPSIYFIRLGRCVCLSVYLMFLVDHFSSSSFIDRSSHSLHSSLIVYLPQLPLILILFMSTSIFPLISVIRLRRSSPAFCVHFLASQFVSVCILF